MYIMKSEKEVLIEDSTFCLLLHSDIMLWAIRKQLGDLEEVLINWLKPRGEQ